MATCKLTFILFHMNKSYEPRHEITGFLHMRKQRRRSASLISAFVFATDIVQSLFFLITKFQASSHFLWLYSPVCVGPGRKSRRPVFSQRGSMYYYHALPNIKTGNQHSRSVTATITRRLATFASLLVIERLSPSDFDESLISLYIHH